MKSKSVLDSQIGQLQSLVKEYILEIQELDSMASIISQTPGIGSSIKDGSIIQDNVEELIHKVQVQLSMLEEVKALINYYRRQAKDSK